MDWLKEQSRSLFQDDYVQLYEALRFVVQEHVVVKGFCHDFGRGH